MNDKETLEEAAREYYKRGQLGFEKAADTEMAFLKGAKWQQEQEKITTDDAYNEGFENGKHWQQEKSYSEEEVKEILFHRETHYMKTAHHLHINEWFEQFKK